MGMKSKLAITFAYDSENSDMCGEDCPFMLTFKEFGHCKMFGMLELSDTESYSINNPKVIRCSDCLEAQRKWDKKIDRINKAEQGGK